MRDNTVIIVENHTLLLQAIGNIVDSFKNFKIISLCKNGQELIKKMSSPKNIPDIILMDINMPIMNGIEATEWVTEHHPDVKVMALSVEDGDLTIIKMLKAGAKGYLLKDVEQSILENALIDVIENGFHHSKKVTNLLIQTISGNHNPIVLKENEIIFMKYACTEMTYREIAKKMYLSPKTIDGYRDSLFDKLDIKNRVGLVMYAIKNKIFIP